MDRIDLTDQSKLAKIKKTAANCPDVCATTQRDYSRPLVVYSWIGDMASGFPESHAADGSCGLFLAYHYDFGEPFDLRFEIRPKSSQQNPVRFQQPPQARLCRKPTVDIHVKSPPPWKLMRSRHGGKEGATLLPIICQIADGGEYWFDIAASFADPQTRFPYTLDLEVRVVAGYRQRR